MEMIFKYQGKFEYSNLKKVIRIWKLDSNLLLIFESNFHIRITFLRFEYSNLP